MKLGEVREKDGKIKVLSVKVTSHSVRDEYDVTIINYSEAGLKLKSVARTSKTQLLDSEYFIKKFGDLTREDLDKIIETYIKFISNQDIK